MVCEIMVTQWKIEHKKLWMQAVLILLVGGSANISPSVISCHHFHKIRFSFQASWNLNFEFSQHSML
jgi:hypothetical protein